MITQEQVRIRYNPEPDMLPTCHVFEDDRQAHPVPPPLTCVSGLAAGEAYSIFQPDVDSSAASVAQLAGQQVPLQLLIC